MSAPGALTEASPGQTDRVAAALAKVNATAALPEPITSLPATEPDNLTAEQARQLTDEIKVDAEVLWDKLARAYTERAWDALGYATWDTYYTAEFESLRLRLPREERQEVVRSLREGGYSIRAIAASVGISDQTVQKDIKTGRSESLHPTSEPDEPVDVEVVPTQTDDDGSAKSDLSPFEKKARRRKFNTDLSPLRVALREMPNRVAPLSALAETEEFRAWFADADSRGPDVRREITRAIEALKELRDRLP